MNKTLREHFDESYVNDGWHDAVEDTFDEVERRLSALEHPEPDKQPSAQPAETDREWIDLRAVYWIYYKDGNVALGHLSDCLRGFTHIMPYHPGDKQPEPPKMGGE